MSNEAFGLLEEAKKYGVGIIRQVGEGIDIIDTHTFTIFSI
jgi:hypothetical protein